MPTILPFTVQRDVPLREVSPDYCWFHPRAAAIPGHGRDGRPAVVMTLQKELAIDDFYSGMYFMRTDDLGATWAGPTEIASLAWRHAPNGVIISVCDVTPGWHARTGKLLAIGAQLRYSPRGAQLEDIKRAQETAYATFDPASGAWSGWSVVAMPDEPRFNFSRAACSQWLVEADGTLLLAFYHATSASVPAMVTAGRCRFDGTTITLLTLGNTLELPVVRGLCEPSLARFGGRYFLTLRNDLMGYVSTSDDGLHFGPIQPWTFDDGAELGSYNTQQHWLVHSDGLFLCYTRRGYNNDHIPRNRAPLFIAQVDTERLCVLRATEQVLIPERGMMLGNFGAAPVTAAESWVTDSEYVCLKNGYGPSPRGGDGSTFVARVHWGQPNRLVG